MKQSCHDQSANMLRNHLVRFRKKLMSSHSHAIKYATVYTKYDIVCTGKISVHTTYHAFYLPACLPVFLIDFIILISESSIFRCS